MECRLFDATQISPSIVNPAIILLTRLPGCGKTSLVRRVIERLDGLYLAGFYTQELLGHDGRRGGFEAIGLNGSSKTLAYVSSKSKVRVDRDGVEIAGFEQLINEELAGEPVVDLIVVDEIGKMECFSRRFVDLVRQLLESMTPVLAGVALKGGGLILEAKEGRDVELISVSARNRDDLAGTLVERLASEPVAATISDACDSDEMRVEAEGARICRWTGTRRKICPEPTRNPEKLVAWITVGGIAN